MNLEVFLVSWIKSGLIAWAAWFVLSVTYVIVKTGADPVKIGRLSEEASDPETGFKNLSFAGKACVIARTIIWPWGVTDRAVAMVRAVERVL